MKYVHPDHNVVINAQGGYAVLERLGFKPENQKEDEMAKKKKAALKKAEKPASKTAAAKTEKAEVSGQSRNELMLEVKSRGIKNFRVMNKAELVEIVAGVTPERLKEIEEEAVARWKSGWSKK